MYQRYQECRVLQLRGYALGEQGWFPRCSSKYSWGNCSELCSLGWSVLRKSQAECGIRSNSFHITEGPVGLGIGTCLAHTCRLFKPTGLCFSPWGRVSSLAAPASQFVSRENIPKVQFHSFALQRRRFPSEMRRVRFPQAGMAWAHNAAIERVRSVQMHKPPGMIFSFLVQGWGGI